MFANTPETIQPSHPFGVALSQVIVDGDNMHAPPAQRVQVYGQGRRNAQVEMTNAAMILLCLWYFIKHKSDNRHTWVYVLGIIMARVCRLLAQ